MSLKTTAINMFKKKLAKSYEPMKKQPTENKIVFLSRESNEPSLDMLMLSEEIRRLSPETKQVFRCRKMKGGASEMMKYLDWIKGDMQEIATSKVAITDTYSIPISVLEHKPELFVIQIWHSMGNLKMFGRQSLGKKEGRDTEVSDAMNMHQGYDVVFAPSRETARSYAVGFGVPEEKFELYTLPRIDYVLKDDKEMEERFFQENPQAKDKRIVLYLPTFREGEGEIVKSICQAFIGCEEDGLYFIPSLHPLSEFKQDKGITGDYNTFDLIKLADSVITDYSACAFEAAVANRKLYFYVPDFEEYDANRGVNIDIRAEMDGCIYYDAQELRNAICDGAYDDTNEKIFARKYVENTENCTRRMAEYVISKL